MMELENICEKKIFSTFVGNLRGSNGKETSFMDCRDDVIFLWDSTSGCLLTQGLQSCCNDFQELHPTEQPGFEVTKITVNSTGTRAALWSSAGVAVLDLPWRCGPRLEYQDGKKQIIVKCRNLNLKDFDVDDEVLQVRWHPNSINDCGLFVLLSDNTIHCIDRNNQIYSPVKLIRVGCRPLSRQKTLSLLGETAVDFCFATLPGDERNKETTALLVLRGNGDVSLVLTESENEEFPGGQMLPISPLADDNLANESSSILVIPGRPSAVVLATTRGALYHALLVPFDVDQVDVPVHRRLYRLLVIESVLLDVGLHLANDDVNPFPVRLLLDPGHLRRYLVIHPAGVHSVVVNGLLGVQKLMKLTDDADGYEIGGDLQFESGSSRKIAESSMECTLCTNQPLQGCTVLPGILLAIDAESNVVQRPLRAIELHAYKVFDTDGNKGMETPLTQEMRKPFTQQLEQLLQESRVLPRMCFPSQDMQRDQLLALIVRMANLVRKVTIPRYRQIRAILVHRAHLITSMQQLQLQEIARLESERTKIVESAEIFGEKIQMIADDLEDQRERVSKVCRRIAEVRPVPTDAERRMELMIDEVEKNAKEYKNALQRLKKDQAYQDSKIVEDTETGPMSLSGKQADALRICLSGVGDKISDLVRQVNDINNILGLDVD